MKYMQQNSTYNTIKGSVTIFLSISIGLIVSLVFYTIESCHLDVLVARSEGITYLSLDSLFGQYCLPLFEEYGLFCLNEQGLDLENEIKKYNYVVVNDENFNYLTIDLANTITNEVEVDHAGQIVGQHAEGGC